MSVDYYACDYCGDIFCDCGDYVSCECGKHWCSEECAEEDGFERGHCGLNKDTDDGVPEEDCDFAKNGECNSWGYECEHWTKESCKYCRNEDFDDYKLLNFALEVLNVTREELIEDYKKKNKLK